LNRAVVAALLLLTACASKPPLVPPQWDTVPGHIAEALCTRLKMDAVASGSLLIVNVTQPLAAGENRAIPIALGTSCEWTGIDARDIRKHRDEMVVELSNPVADRERGEVGMLARVTLGGEHPAWYWISLIPYRDQWAVRFVFALSK